MADLEGVLYGKAYFEPTLEREPLDFMISDWDRGDAMLKLRAVYGDEAEHLPPVVYYQWCAYYALKRVGAYAGTEETWPTESFSVVISDDPPPSPAPPST